MHPFLLATNDLTCYYQIDFEKRKLHDEGNDCLLSVDSTDCPIEEKGKKWYSHMFKKPGVRYEVGVRIKTSDICWIKGPLPCGEFPDLTIFRMALKHCLVNNERVEADLGYRGENPDPDKVKTPGPLYMDEKYVAMKSNVASHHETVNKCLKQYNCLMQQFQHGIAKHAACFRGVAVLAQLAIEHGEPLYQVEYSDNY